LKPTLFQFTSSTCNLGSEFSKKCREALRLRATRGFSPLFCELFLQGQEDNTPWKCSREQRLKHGWFTNKKHETEAIYRKRFAPLLHSQHRQTFVTIFLIFFIFQFSNSLAQDSLEQLRQQISDGYYASATQISGPQAVRDNPDNPEAYFLYSQALLYAEETLEARVQFDQALSLIGSDPPPEYIHLNGLITAAEGKLSEAVVLLETAFLRSQRYDIAMDWARLAWQAGNFDEALKAYQAAASTEAGQKDIAPYLNQGRIFQVAKGDAEAAIAAYQTALDVFDANDPGGALAPPGVVEANFRLGEVYESLGDKATAKTYYDAALALDRNYAPAKNALDRLVRNP
jgi:tetratricopeptide (TPR) repeat protein